MLLECIIIHLDTPTTATEAAARGGGASHGPGAAGFAGAGNGVVSSTSGIHYDSHVDAFCSIVDLVAAVAVVMEVQEDLVMVVQVVVDWSLFHIHIHPKYLKKL